MQELVTIPERFNGPPGSANGGYACGVVAAAIGAGARVSLRRPPPLETPLRRERDDGGSVRLLDGDAVVAEGEPGEPSIEVPPPPSIEQAQAAQARFGGRDPDRHAFPTCFVCGPLRGSDGLRLFPGPVGGGDALACVWRPAGDLAGSDGLVDPVFLWSALDCPSGFACIPPDTVCVLAAMTAAIEAAVRPGERLVASAWPLAREGRKHRAGSALHREDGTRVAVAEALWIALRAPAEG